MKKFPLLLIGCSILAGCSSHSDDHKAKSVKPDQKMQQQAPKTQEKKNHTEQGKSSQTPEVKPQQPEAKPQQPEVKPQQPEVKPQQPEVKPQQPEVKLQQPEVKLQQPEVKPQQPEVKPQQPEVKPQQPEVKPQQPEVKPQQPEVKPQEPEVQPQLPETPEQVNTEKYAQTAIYPKEGPLKSESNTNFDANKLKIVIDEERVIDVPLTDLSNDFQPKGHPNILERPNKEVRQADAFLLYGYCCTNSKYVKSGVFTITNYPDTKEISAYGRHGVFYQGERTLKKAIDEQKGIFKYTGQAVTIDNTHTFNQGKIFLLADFNEKDIQGSVQLGKEEKEAYTLRGNIMKPNDDAEHHYEGRILSDKESDENPNAGIAGRFYGDFFGPNADETSGKLEFNDSKDNPQRKVGVFNAVKKEAFKTE
ncbi:hypothetical protein A4G19_07110 [Pasteurellaceae bacterium Macca]|nr:hypothetical protein [Pasteurellaceae bacterium Macca]